MGVRVRSSRPERDEYEASLESLFGDPWDECVAKDIPFARIKDRRLLDLDIGRLETLPP